MISINVRLIPKLTPSYQKKKGIVFSLMILQIHFHLKGSLRPNPVERTSTLPTTGTLPHWRHHFTGNAEFGMQATCDSRLQNSPSFASGDIDVDRVSLKYNADRQTKGGAAL